MAYFNGLYTQLLEFEYLLNSFIDIEELKNSWVQCLCEVSFMWTKTSILGLDNTISQATNYYLSSQW